MGEMNGAWEITQMIKGAWTLYATCSRMFKIVFQDSAVIKGQLFRKRIPIKDTNLQGIIRSRWSCLASAPSHENDGNVVLSWIPIRIRIGAKLGKEFHIKGGLLFGLSDGCLL